METRANYLVVGLFALVAVTAAAFFTWWQSSGTGGTTREVLFVFPGSVAGLTPGSPILFNGIKVGDVTNISLDPQDLQVVNVRARVQETAPIKTDTRATVDQGLTGWATVGLSGGSFTAESVFDLVEEGETPRLIGQQAALSQLLAEGETIAARVNSILDQTNNLLEQNGPEINATVANTSIISGNLAEASRDVATVLSAAGDVAESFQGLSGEVGGLTDQVLGIVGAIDVAQINTALGNVAAITGTLAESEDEIANLLGNADAASTQLTQLLTQAGSFAAEARQAVSATRSVITTVEGLATAIEPDRVNAIVANVEAATGLVQDNAPAISRIARNAGEASERINTILADAGDIGTVAGEAVRAIDPVALGDTVANVRALSQTLADTGESISATVSSAQTATERVAAALEGSGGVGAQVGAIVAEIEPAAVRATVAAAEAAATRLGESVAAVDPVALGDAVANVRTLTETLATSAEGVGRTIASVDRAAASAANALEGTDGLGDRINTIVAGVDPSALSQTVAAVRDAATSAQASIGGVDPEALGDAIFNVRTLTGTLAQSAEGVGRTVASVEAAATRAASALEGTETVGADVAALVAGIDPVALGETVASVRDTTAAAERAVGAIDPEALGDTVFNVRSLTGTLANSAEGLSRTIASVETAASRAATALAGTETIGADAAALVAGVDPVALGETVASVRGATAAAERTLGAIDPEALGDTVFNVRSLTGTLAESAESVGRAVASVETAAARAATALEGTETLGARLGGIAEDAGSLVDQAGAIVNGVAPETVTTLVENAAAASGSANALLEGAQSLPASIDATLGSTRGAVRQARGVLEAVDPAAIRQSLTNVETLTTSLAEQAPQIEATVANVRSASERANAVLGDASEFSASFSEVSEAASELVTRLDGLVAGVEPEAIAETVNNVRDVTITLAENREAIGQALQDVSGLATRLRESADRVDGLLASANGLVDEEARVLLANASSAAQSLRDLSTDLGRRVPQIASNLDNFTGRGLEGLSELIEEGQRTVGSLDRVIGSVESNPEQFLFGRSGNSDYQPRGRQ